MSAGTTKITDLHQHNKTTERKTEMGIPKEEYDELVKAGIERPAATVAAHGRNAGADSRASRGYTAPVRVGTMWGHTIEIRDLDHPEAIHDLIALLKEVPIGDSVRIKKAV